MSLLEATPLQRSRGMRDLLPGEMRAFRRVEDAFRTAALNWGYEEIRTPTIEPYSLFTAAGALTPEMLSGVYSFLDWDGWSGERVVLRPDSTIPVARSLREARLPLPARLFYVQNVFRFRPAAEDREDWQAGIEYLDAPATVGDLEVATVGCDTLAALGMRPLVRLSHVGVARAVIERLAAPGPERTAMSEEAAVQGLAALRPALAGDPKAAAFIDVAMRPAGGPALLANLAALAQAGLPAALPALDELGAVAAALMGSGRAVEIDLGMPRDFAYYGGVVFDFLADGEQWGGGGRYTPTGEGVPETGCGLGLDVSRLAHRFAQGGTKRLVVSVVPSSNAALSRALDVARALHRSGIAAALASHAGQSVLSVIVGEDSIAAQTPDGSQRVASLDKVIELFVQYK